jgi:coenzyme F420 biosynthesis associated uncharacterized protein
MTGMIDWDFAVTVASKVAGEGPEVTRDEAVAAVQELRDGANRSTSLVRDFTGLDAPEGTAPVLVVERRGWVQANAVAFDTMLAPIVDKLTERKGQPTGLVKAVGSRVTGAEVGMVLGFLGSKVLGQFDPFHDPAGRLLLVAPNIVHVERELEVDPHDFRLWVCLHEETHRVQFTAVPWMRDHLFAQMQAMADAIDPTAMLDGGIQRLAEALRGQGSGGLLDVVSSPEQKVIVERITGMMSLLEGHADVVMDGVGPRVIPSVEAIRGRFNERRKGVGMLDKVLRRLLGLDAKMAQYRDGAKFVRHVVDRVGMAEFNAVWQGPETLPSKDEIHDPDAWIARVL